MEALANGMWCDKGALADRWGESRMGGLMFWWAGGWWGAGVPAFPCDERVPWDTSGLLSDWWDLAVEEGCGFAKEELLPPSVRVCVGGSDIGTFCCCWRCCTLARSSRAKG